MLIVGAGETLSMAPLWFQAISKFLLLHLLRPTMRLQMHLVSAFAS